jgi:hypothetical protein
MLLTNLNDYSLIDPFADGYYKIGEKKNAQDLLASSPSTKKT